MIMRESEATTKVCPEISTPDSRVNCIGSHCMFWLAGPPEVEVFVIPQGLRVPPAAPDGDGWYLGISNNSPAYIRITGKTGGCSLANK